MTALAGIVAIVAVGLATADSPPPGPTPPPNPDFGLSNRAIQTNHAASRAEFEQKYRSWLADFVRSGRDPRSLERLSVNAFYEPGKNSMREAVQGATLVVVAQVSKADFEAFVGTHLTVEVQSVAKGPVQPGTIIRVLMGGGPMPTLDFKGAALAIYENAPLLLPGDRALLVLEGPLASGEYYPQSWTGLYNLHQGTVRALEGSPFRSQIDGLSEEAVIALAAAEAR
jgi:hypothetical protein